MTTVKLFLGVAFVVLSFLVALPAGADTTATFPVNSAGLGAYVKLDSFDPAYFDIAQKSLFHDAAAVGSTYLIGVKTYYAADNSQDPIDLRIYIGSDGWLVAYLGATEISSRIVNWQTGATLDNNLLNVAIADVTQTLGASHNNSTIAYYDFSHQSANRITLAKKSFGYDSDTSKSFSVYVPGTVWQEAFAAKGENGDGSESIILSAGGNQIAAIAPNSFGYGSYGSAITGRASCQIVMAKANQYPIQGKTVTVIIYQVN